MANVFCPNRELRVLPGPGDPGTEGAFDPKELQSLVDNQFDVLPVSARHRDLSCLVLSCLVLSCCGSMSVILWFSLLSSILFCSGRIAWRCASGSLKTAAARRTCQSVGSRCRRPASAARFSYHRTVCQLIRLETASLYEETPRFTQTRSCPRSQRLTPQC